MKLFALVCCALALLTFSACGKKALPPAANPNAFDKAAPELKQIWDIALAADKTNEYAAAQTLLYRLLQQQLTPEQQQAVEQQLSVAKAHFQQALDKGDANAKAALDEMRRNAPNRQR